jgi:hypothetical protein
MAASASATHLEDSTEVRLSAFILECLPSIVADHFMSIQQKTELGTITSEESKIVRWRTQRKNSSAAFFESVVGERSEVIKSAPMFVEGEMLKAIAEEAKYTWFANQALVNSIVSKHLPEVLDGEIEVLVHEAAKQFYFSFPASLASVVDKCRGKPLENLSRDSSYTLKTLVLTETSGFVLDHSSGVVLDRGSGSIGTSTAGSNVSQFYGPYEMAISSPSALHSGGLLFVADTFNQRVQVFDGTSLTFIRSIDTGFPGIGLALLSPTDNLPKGLLYISSYDSNCVLVINLETYKLHKNITGIFNAPHGLTVLQPNKEYPEGLLFVANSDSHCVIVLSAISCEYCYTIGRKDLAGSAIGQLRSPRGLALQLPTEVSPKYLLYVTEIHNNRVQVFNAATGEHVRMLGDGKISGPGNFNTPSGVAVQSRKNGKYPGGAVYVTDTGNKLVQVFHATTGKHLGILARSQGRLARGICVCSDVNGRNLVFITNWENHNIEILLDT